MCCPCVVRVQSHKDDEWPFEIRAVYPRVLTLFIWPRTVRVQLYVAYSMHAYMCVYHDVTPQVVRNVGVPFGHTLIGFKSLMKGLGKIKVNAPQLSHDLDDNW